MFVPVACSACAKPFQVPEAAVGTTTACPWCGAAVLALPLGGTTTELGGMMPPARREAEPLTLDDDVPAMKAGPRGRRAWVWVVPAAIALGVAVTALTIGVLRYKQGHLIGSEWKHFTAPDGSCAIDQLGQPVEDAEAPGEGERRYVSEGWYSGTSAWVGWKNLTVAQVQMANSDDGWRTLRPMLDIERDRVKGKYGGYVARDATTKFKDPLTVEVRLDTPNGLVIERMIVLPGGPRPRVYFLGMAGKRLAPDGPEVQRFFDSFKVFE